MRIGVDVDDVLADFVNRYLAISREMFGRPADGIVPNDWEMSNIGLTPEEHKAVWDRIQATPNFWETLSRKQFTQELDAASREHTLFFITSRVETAGDPVEVQTAEWLWKKGVDYPTVIVATKGVRKGELAQALKLDAFIDDRKENVIEVKAANPEMIVAIKSTAHNADFDNARYGIERVNSFDGFIRRLESIEARPLKAVK